MNFREPTLAPFDSWRLLVLFSALAIPAVAAAEPLVPCSDPNGCPDLIVDQNKLKDWKIQRKNFSADDCAVDEGMTKAGKRTLLRFTFTTPNLGPGALIVGDPLDPDNADLFEFDTCHGHAHYKEYADYRLWTLNGYMRWQALRHANPGALASELLAANPKVAAKMVSAAKQGFCVGDVVSYFSTVGPVYGNCDELQGTSVGWADEYGSGLDGQWIDITRVARGKYMLEAEVNAEQVFEEKKDGYRNNSAAVPVTIRRAPRRRK